MCTLAADRYFGARYNNIKSEKNELLQSLDTIYLRQTLA